jgi:hypothetical protein
MAQLAEEEARTFLIAGLRMDANEDLGALVNLLLHDLHLPAQVQVLNSSRLPSRTKSDGSVGSSNAAPPLVKVALVSSATCRSVLAAARNLKDSDSFSRVYLRPLRPLQDRKLIKLRLQRCLILREDDKNAPGISYKVMYNRPLFPILRLESGVPNWRWSDPGWDEWASAQVKSAASAVPRLSADGSAVVVVGLLAPEDRAWAEQVEAASTPFRME